MTGRAFALALAASMAACNGAAPPAASPEKPQNAPVEAACPTAVDHDAEWRAPPPLAGVRVAKVCFLGSTRSTFEQLRAALLSAEGQPFDEQKVQRDIRRLFALGDLDDVHVYADTVPGGVVLVYAVHDRPLLKDLRFEGAKALGEADLRRMMSMPADAPFDPARLQRQADFVRTEYVARGYARAAVKASAEPASGGFVRALVQIDEGPRVAVSQIAFKGAKKVSEADLRRAMGTHVGDVYREEKLARDALLITALYYDRGMLQVDVQRAPQAGSPDTGARTVTFEISEGPVFKLGRLTFLGDLAGSEKEHLALLSAKPGQVFNRSALMEDIQRIVAFAKARGSEVEVSPETEIHPREGKVDLAFRVSKSATSP